MSRLTKAQEKFVKGLLEGKTQLEAMLEAYPQRKNWTKSSQEVQACLLLKNPKVRGRYDELMSKVRKKEQEKLLWTREQAIENLKYIINKNQDEIEMISSAYNEELQLLYKKLKENPNEAEKYLKEIIKSKKGKRISSINNSGIIQAVSELNRMQGFNEETINLHGAVQFTDEDKLKD